MEKSIRKAVGHTQRKINKPYYILCFKLTDTTNGKKFERGMEMPHTSDNDKKAQDNNALRHEKNMMREKNRQAGKNQYSKKTDHK